VEVRLEELVVNKYKNLSFEDYKRMLISFSEEIKRIPTKDEITRSEIFPDPAVVRSVFKMNGYNSYVDFLIERGFEIKRKKSPFSEFSYEDLINLWEQYREINGKYPTAEICASDCKLPTWDRVKKICGEKFKEFYKIYGNGNIHFKEDYEEYCNLFIKLSKEKGSILSSSDLLQNEYGLPESRWLVKNCPDSNVKNYNQFINYLGLKPNYEISREYAINAIMNKYKEVNRNLFIKDFFNPKPYEIGITTIDNHWGSFNNMLKDLGLPINQEGMSLRQRGLSQLVYDIIKLCNHIKNKENRDIISRDDVKNCEWCLDPQSYDRWFKRKFDMTLSQFIDHIGFKSNKPGMGLIFEFEDGEVTTSQFEYTASHYLRENNITYQRNVKYSTFVPNYKEQKISKDCDYVIETKNHLWYVEIAGMLDYRKVSQTYDDEIRKTYKRKLSEKEKMLQQTNLNYKILYPSDFVNPLDEVFSFLFEDIEIKVVS
jgi:hypothetical protein